MDTGGTLESAGCSPEPLPLSGCPYRPLAARAQPTQSGQAGEGVLAKPVELCDFTTINISIKLLSRLGGVLFSISTDAERPASQSLSTPCAPKRLGGLTSLARPPGAPGEPSGSSWPKQADKLARPKLFAGPTQQIATCQRAPTTGSPRAGLKVSPPGEPLGALPSTGPARRATGGLEANPTGTTNEFAMVSGCAAGGGEEKVGSPTASWDHSADSCDKQAQLSLGGLSLVTHAK